MELSNCELDTINAWIGRCNRYYQDIMCLKSIPNYDIYINDENMVAQKAAETIGNLRIFPSLPFMTSSMYSVLSKCWWLHLNAEPTDFLDPQESLYILLKSMKSLKTMIYDAKQQTWEIVKTVEGYIYRKLMDPICEHIEMLKGSIVTLFHDPSMAQRCNAELEAILDFVRDFVRTDERSSIDVAYEVLAMLNDAHMNIVNEAAMKLSEIAVYLENTKNLPVLHGTSYMEFRAIIAAFEYDIADAPWL